MQKLGLKAFAVMPDPSTHHKCALLCTDYSWVRFSKFNSKTLQIQDSDNAVEIVDRATKA